MDAQPEENVIEDVCFKRADRKHCEHWEEDGKCCDCSATSSAVCSLCGAENCPSLESDDACPAS